MSRTRTAGRTTALELQELFRRPRYNEVTSGAARIKKSRKHMLVTPRRNQILNLIRAGKSRAQIAAELRLGLYTVRDHIRLLQRAGLVKSGDPYSIDWERARRSQLGERLPI